MTGPPSISATPVSEPSINASRSAWTMIRVGGEVFSSPVVEQSSTNPSAIRWGYGSNMPDSGLGGIRSALSRIEDSTIDISIPGRSAARRPLIPSKLYWIDNHRSRHDATPSSDDGGWALLAARSSAGFDKPKHSEITASSVSGVASFEIAS